MRRLSKFAAVAATLALSIWMAPASSTQFPGPDPFGYLGTSIPFDWIDISATGSAAFDAPVDDAVTAAIPIGFNFSFYGTAYTDAYIGTNGFLTFSAGNPASFGDSGVMVGTTSPSNMVAGWFGDLVANGGRGSTSGPILYQTLGPVGSREFVVQYLDLNWFLGMSAGSYVGALPNSFEIILREASNDIELQYLTTSNPDPGPYQDEWRSVGINNAGGTVGLQLLWDQSTTYNSQGFCISAGGTICQPNNVPEPGSLILLAAGMIGLAWTRRRTQAQVLPA
jgi:hypothetical protein